jgi:hypothetical protein
VAGFGSESVAGFLLECMAGFVGIRIGPRNPVLVDADDGCIDHGVFEIWIVRGSCKTPIFLGVNPESEREQCGIET